MPIPSTAAALSAAPATIPSPMVIDRFMLVSGFTGVHQTHAKCAPDAIARVAEEKEASKARMPADGISIDFEDDWTSARPLCARQDTANALMGCRVGRPDRLRSMSRSTSVVSSPLERQL
jgi:hypothetical protein